MSEADSGAHDGTQLPPGATTPDRLGRVGSAAEQGLSATASKSACSDGIVILRPAAEEAVRDLNAEDGVTIWWADRDRQSPEEQERRQRNVVVLAGGAFL